MCIDCRYPNAFVALPKFHLETLERDFKRQICKDMWMFTTDIKKAYYNVPLAKQYQKFYCFSHRGKTYCPTILIFWTSQAPFFFNKIMRQIVIFIRKIGIDIQNYFDDNIWFADD